MLTSSYAAQPKTEFQVNAGYAVLTEKQYVSTNYV